MGKMKSENQDKNELNNTMQNELSDNNINESIAIKRTLRDIGILFAIGFIYYLIQKYTHKGFVCYFRALFHIYCPTCGVTRMIMSMSRLELKKAFLYNQFMFITFPFWVGEIIYFFYILESKKKVNKVNQACVFIWIGMLILFGILRNIFHW